MIFEPTGRTTTKRVPGVQLGIWKILQKQEKAIINPPAMYLELITTNSRIRSETRTKEEKKADNRHASPMSTTFIEGILFPEDESSPRMATVKFDRGHDKGKYWQKPDLSPYIPGDASIGCLRVDSVLVPGGDILIAGMIAIFFNERFLEDGSKRNNCVSQLTNGKTARPWAGPFFALIWIHIFKQSWNRIYRCWSNFLLLEQRKDSKRWVTIIFCADAHSEINQPVRCDYHPLLQPLWCWEL